MRRLRPIGLFGLVTLGLVLAISMGTRPALRAQQPTATIAASSVGGGFGGAQDEATRPTTTFLPAPPMTVAESKVRLKLQEKLTLGFPDDTPLEEVLKYVREKTADKADFPDGLPIYVDRVGLQEADQSPASPVVIDLKGIPLATTLKLTLAQLNLAYWVNPDGLVIVTSKDNEDIPMAYEGTVLHQLSELRREVAFLRAEFRLSRGVPAGGMASMGGSMGGSMGSAGGGVR